MSEFFEAWNWKVWGIWMCGIIAGSFCHCGWWVYGIICGISGLIATYIEYKSTKNSKCTCHCNKK